MDLSKDKMKLSIPGGNFTVKSVEYSGGKLRVKVDFSTDLEGLSSSALLSMDESLINVPSLSCRFSSVSQTVPLVIYSEYGNALLFELVCKIFGIIGLGILLLGSLFHKMIGVETIQTYQLVLMMLVFQKKLSLFSHSF